MNAHNEKTVLTLKSSEETGLGASISFVINLITMRRLHRTLLVILAVLSFIGFLMYKHEYDRLSNILHVLHTFGQTSCDQQASGAVPRTAEASFTVPNALLGIWQKVGPVYTYSAVWDLNVIKIFALLPITASVKQIQFRKCVVRHVRSDSEQHLTSESSVSIEVEMADMSVRSSWRVVYFVCNFDGSTPPYSVSLSSEEQSSNSSDAVTLPSIPIVHLNPLLLRLKSANMSIAVCAPIASHLADGSMISQFIEFHGYIGVSRITLYDFASSPQTLRHVSSAQTKNPQLTLQILPWNFPQLLESGEPDATTTTTSSLSMMKRDCIFRHSDHHFVVLLNPNQIVVPRFHSHLSSFLRDEEELSDSLGIAHLSPKTFCSEFPSNPYVKLATVFPMFLKTYWVQASDEEKDNAVIVNPRAIRSFGGGGAPNIKPGYHELHVDSEIAAIHTYASCGPNTSYARYDNVIARKFGSHFVPILNL